eukprot:2715306-Pyramimonas_sp.AAC.1
MSAGAHSPLRQRAPSRRASALPSVKSPSSGPSPFGSKYLSPGYSTERAARSEVAWCTSAPDIQPGTRMTSASFTMSPALP